MSAMDDAALGAIEARANAQSNAACGVCMGHSPSWDGHDRGCAVAFLEACRTDVPALVAALRAEREEVGRLVRLVNDQRWELDRRDAAIARAEAAEAEVARLTGPHRCCEHCADDPIHDVPKDGHEVACQLCQDWKPRAEAAEAAIAAVRALHTSWRIYDECECTDDDKADDETHVSVEDVGRTCRLMYLICRECCCDDVDREYQSEACASYHEHTTDPATICATRRALDTGATS